MADLPEHKSVVETDVTKLKGMMKIKNQRIPHILITPTFTCAMIIYAILAVILGLLGSLSYLKATENNDFRIRYDDQCQGFTSCEFTFTVANTLTQPKLYYELENFYANHRNFVKSRSFS